MFSFLIREIASSRLGGINTQAINGGASRMTSRKSHLEEIRHADPKESLFARVVGGTIPVDVVYEDEHVLAFNDINPQAPHHILVIPKVPIGGPSEFDVKDEQQKMILGHLLQIGAEIAKRKEFSDHGYRMVFNEGRDGAQSVRWLHLHILGGRPMSWPPG